MEEFWATIVDAHNEVMDALGVANITSKVIEAVTTGPGVFDGLRAFIDAVDWTEPFFLYLAMFHLSLFGLAVGVSWDSPGRTAGVMLFLLALSVSSSALNDLGKQHYQYLFVDQKTNYFDDRGVFISAVFAGPLMVLAFVLQIKMFIGLAKMMIVVKRGKFREEQKQQRNQQQQSKDTTVPANKGGEKKHKKA